MSAREKYTIRDWDDFWRIYEEMLSILKEERHSDTVTDFKDAKYYVNGMTDGWYDFKGAFEDALNKHIGKMGEKEQGIAIFIRDTLREAFKQGFRF